MYASLCRTVPGRAPKQLVFHEEDQDEKPRTKKERWDDLMQFIEDTRKQYDPEEQQNKSAYEHHKGSKKKDRTDDKEKEKSNEKSSRKRQKTS